MKLRELTPAQQNALRQKCEETFTYRDNAWRNIQPERFHEIRAATHQLSFSDGIKAVLDMISELPDLPKQQG